ncbi:MAG: phosphoribosylformylglycinamidine synthase I [Thermoproteota archaeon]
MSNRVKACILRVGGTNCDLEVKLALEELGVIAEIVHMKKLGKDGLSKYHMLIIPGGFSYGDYVRAGAILGKEMVSRLRDQLIEFIEENKLVMGICNGFQVLIEAGMLPDEELTGIPKAALATNLSAKYECRWVWLRVENNETPFTKKIKREQVLMMPVGHHEGRFTLSSEKDLDRLIKEKQIVFRYASPNGNPANGKYPFNPNGSFYDIAGIVNKRGNILGLMPHPERAFFSWQLPYEENKTKKYGDGRLIFEGAVEYVLNNFV